MAKRVKTTNDQRLGMREGQVMNANGPDVETDPRLDPDFQTDEEVAGDQAQADGPNPAYHGNFENRDNDGRRRVIVLTSGAIINGHVLGSAGKCVAMLEDDIGNHRSRGVALADVADDAETKCDVDVSKPFVVPEKDEDGKLVNESEQGLETVEA